MLLLWGFPDTIRGTDKHSVWVPTWMHLSFYIEFFRSGRNNIDIVPTMVTEELWVALSLVSASKPVLMRVAKKFITSGVTFTTTISYGSKDSTVLLFLMCKKCLINHK